MKHTETIHNDIAYAPADIFGECIKRGMAVCFFRLPGSDNLHIVADDNYLTVYDELETDNLSGFVFAPFEKSANRPTVVINKNISFKYRLGDESNMPVYVQSKNAELVFGKATNDQVQAPQDAGPSPAVKETRQGYENAVAACVEKIRSGAVQKVVLSRTKEAALPAGFKPVNLFLKLCSLYKNCFISLFSSPETGTWAGASPELLLSVNGENKFKTVALAGTQLANDDVPLSRTLWTQKEIEEQALVSRYIINCFKRIRLREFDEIGPKTVRAGDLLHLKTELLVNLNEVNFDNLAPVMLQLLHPTSAVCGMPKENALQFIREHEPTERSYYSGFMGPVNLAVEGEELDRETHIYVNIRCARLLPEKAIVYAGAGITEDSNPEKEYIETENKMNTVLRAFQLTLTF